MVLGLLELKSGENLFLYGEEGTSSELLSFWQKMLDLGADTDIKGHYFLGKIRT